MDRNHRFISLDIGTTTIKCLIIDSNLHVIGSAFTKVELLYPEADRVEIDPSWLWNSILSVVNNALYDSHLTAGDIRSLGISTQRSTFITWRKDTGEPFHNFITWKDLRSRDLIEKWNNSTIIRTMRFASYLLYLVTRNARYLAGSRLKMACNHTSSRLLWVLENDANVMKELQNNNVMFGTLDTWLVYKLTKNNTYVTDITNASATGFFDPFTLEWGSWAIHILKIPPEILPPVVANDFAFGSTDVFGAPITISSVLADQSASMLGSCCLNQNDLKITLGTGAFVNMNTGNTIDCKLDGMYPLVGWKLKDKITFITEASCNDCGSLIEWIKLAGYIQDVKDLNLVVNENSNENGEFFIPAFSGLGPPFNDAKASSGFIGVQATTTGSKMALAVLEGITFRIGLAVETMISNRSAIFKRICVDGGVSKNDFICQTLADITDKEIERAEFEEVSNLGVLFSCGLSEGIWSEPSELRKLRTVQKIFKPSNNAEKYKIKLKRWSQAAERFKSWHNK